MSSIGKVSTNTPSAGKSSGGGGISSAAKNAKAIINNAQQNSANNKNQNIKGTVYKPLQTGKNIIGKTTYGTGDDQKSVYTIQRDSNYITSDYLQRLNGYLDSGKTDIGTTRTFRNEAVVQLNQAFDSAEKKWWQEAIDYLDYSVWNDYQNQLNRLGSSIEGYSTNLKNATNEYRSTADLLAYQTDSNSAEYKNLSSKNATAQSRMKTAQGQYERAVALQKQLQDEMSSYFIDRDTWEARDRLKSNDYSDAERDLNFYATDPSMLVNDLSQKEKDQKKIDEFNRSYLIPEQFYNSEDRWKANTASTVEGIGAGLLAGFSDFNKNGLEFSKGVERETFAANKILDKEPKISVEEAVRRRSTVNARIGDLERQRESLQKQTYQDDETLSNIVQIGYEINTLKNELRNYDSVLKGSGSYLAVTGKPFENFTEENIFNFLDSGVDYLDNRSAENARKALEGAGAIEKLGLNVSRTMMEVGFDGAVSLLTGIPALAIMYARVQGSQSADARRTLAAREAAGESVDAEKFGITLTAQQKASLYGHLSAGIEVLTEKLTDGLGLVYGRGKSTDIVEKLIANLAGTPSGMNFLRFIAEANGEGLEEVLSDIINPAIQGIINGESIKHNYSNLEASEILYDYFLGSIMGIAGGVANAATGDYAAKNFARYQNDLAADQVARQNIIQDTVNAPTTSIKDVAQAGGRIVQDEANAEAKLAEQKEKDTPITKALAKYMDIMHNDNAEALTKQEVNLLYAAGIINKQAKTELTKASEVAAQEVKSKDRREKTISRANSLGVGLQENQAPIENTSPALTDADQNPAVKGGDATNFVNAPESGVKAPQSASESEGINTPTDGTEKVKQGNLPTQEGVNVNGQEGTETEPENLHTDNLGGSSQGQRTSPRFERGGTAKNNDVDARYSTRAPRFTGLNAKETSKAWESGAKYIEDECGGTVYSEDELKKTATKHELAIRDAIEKAFGIPVTYYKGNANTPYGFTVTESADSGLFVELGQENLANTVFHELGHRQWRERGGNVSQRKLVTNGLKKGKVSKDEASDLVNETLESWGYSYIAKDNGISRDEWYDMTDDERLAWLQSDPYYDDIVEMMYEEISNILMTGDSYHLAGYKTLGSGVKQIRSMLVNNGIFTQDEMDVVMKAVDQYNNGVKAGKENASKAVKKNIKPISDFDGKKQFALYTVPNPDNPRQKKLVAIRNTSVSSAIRAFKDGGLAMPSIAIMKASHGHEGFGEVSLIFGKDTIDPSKNKENRVYGKDAYTPMHPGRASGYHLEGDVEGLRKELESLLNRFSNVSGFEEAPQKHDVYIDIDSENGEIFVSTNASDEPVIEAAIAAEAGYTIADAIRANDQTNWLPGIIMQKFLKEDAKDRFHPFKLEIAGNTFTPFMSYLGEQFSESDITPETINEIRGMLKKEYPENDYLEDDGIIGAIESALDLLGQYEVGIIPYLGSLVPHSVQESWWNQKLEKYGVKKSENANSLEDILNIMKRQPSRKPHSQGGRDMASVLNYVTHVYNSVDEIIDHEDSLTDRSDHSATEDQYNDAEKSYHDAIQAIAQYNDDYNLYKARDNIVEIAKWLAESADNWDSANGKFDADEEVREIIGEYLGINRDSDKFDNVVNVVTTSFNKMAYLPTGFFESKPQRIVGVNEIVAAIIPDIESDIFGEYGDLDELENLLKESEIKVFKYYNKALTDAEWTAADEIQFKIYDLNAELKNYEDTLAELQGSEEDEILMDDGGDQVWVNADELNQMISECKSAIDEYTKQLADLNIEPKKTREDIMKQDLGKFLFNPKPAEERTEEQRAVPPGTTKQTQNVEEEKTQVKGARALHEERMADLAEKFGISDGTFLSMKREDVSRVANYWIEKYGMQEEWDRLMGSKEWSRVDFSEAGKIVYEMTMQLNRDMLSGKKGLGPVLERQAGESNAEYRERQKAADKQAYLERREPIDALLQMYGQQKSEAGQKLQEQYKFTIADEIRMRASQRFLSYTADGEVQNTSDQHRNAKMWAIMDDLLTRAEKADSSGDKQAMRELSQLVSKIRGREKLLGRLGKNGEQMMLKDLYSSGFDADAMATLMYGNINKIIDDLTPITYADAIQTVRMTNMLSNIATGLNNFENNAMALRLGATAQNLAYPFARVFEKITGKKVAFTDSSFLRFGKGKGRTEKLAMEYALLSAYYGLNSEQGRIDSKTNSGTDFYLNGDGVGGVMGRALARYNFLVNALVLAPDAPAKARANLAMKQGIEKRFEGKELTREEAANKKELEAFADVETKRRVLQDDNALTRAVMYLKNQFNKVETPGATKKVAGRQLGSLKLGDFAIAFAKVPANVGLQKAMATPFGATYQMLRYAYGIGKALNDPESMSTMEMAKISRDIGRAATTWGMVGLGALGAMMGALKNFDDTDDDEEKKLAAEKGYKGLTFNISALLRGGGEWKNDDVVVSGSFLEILAMPLSIGAIMYDAKKENSDMGFLERAWYGTEESFTQAVDAVMDIPGLQQAAQLYETYANGKPDDSNFERAVKAIGEFAVNSATSYFIPNIVSQATAGIDNIQRDVYGTDSYGETLKNIVKNKVSSLRQTLPAKTDTFGNVRTYGDSNIMGVVNTVLLPGDIKKYHVSDLEKEILRLKKETGYNGTLFDSKAPRKLEAGEDAYSLNADQQRAYYMTKAKQLAEAYDTFINSNEYKKLNDQQRLDVMKTLRLDIGRNIDNEVFKTGNIEYRRTLDKWEQELTTLDDKIQYLAAKQLANAAWDSTNNTIGDYDAMDSFMNNEYKALTPPMKDLLDNSLSWLDDMQSAAKVGIDSKAFSELKAIQGKYKDLQDYYHDADLDDESSLTSLNRDMIVEFEDIVSDKMARKWAQNNLRLWQTIPVSTETLEKWQKNTNLSTPEIDKWIDTKDAMKPQGGYKTLCQNQRLMAVRDFNGISAKTQAELEEKRWDMIQREASDAAWGRLKVYKDEGKSVAYALDNAVYWYKDGKRWVKRKYNVIYPKEED